MRTGVDDEFDLDAAADRKQLARDIAAIERATALATPNGAGAAIMV